MCLELNWSLVTLRLLLSLEKDLESVPDAVRCLLTPCFWLVFRRVAVRSVACAWPVFSGFESLPMRRGGFSRPFDAFRFKGEKSSFLKVKRHSFFSSFSPVFSSSFLIHAAIFTLGLDPVVSWSTRRSSLLSWPGRFFLGRPGGVFGGILVTGGVFEWFSRRIATIFFVVLPRYRENRDWRRMYENLEDSLASICVAIEYLAHLFAGDSILPASLPIFVGFWPPWRMIGGCSGPQILLESWQRLLRWFLAVFESQSQRPGVFSRRHVRSRCCVYFECLLIYRTCA